MPRYLIDRKVPGAQQLTEAELAAIAAKSNSVIAGLRAGGTPIQWDHTYVTDDMLHCVYVAPDAESIREHARRGGFPCDNIMQVDTIFDPVTAE
jgi:hypothetical protein